MCLQLVKACKTLWTVSTWVRLSVMFVFTLVQSRTHVDTVHSILHSWANSRDICWSHTMKVLGWHVNFVRRSSATVVTLSSIYFDMKVWSLMYVVSVQSVSVQYLNWNLINRYTRTTNSFAVVCVVKTLNANVLLYNTLRNVLLSWDKATFKPTRWHVFVVVSLRHTSGYVHACLGSHVFLWWSFSLYVLKVHTRPWRVLQLLERKLLLIKLI